MKTAYIIIAVAVVILVALPRFNYFDPWPLNKLGASRQVDSIEYENFVSYIRYESPEADSLVKPFTYRPLLPHMAAALPYSPLTSLNIINLFFLVGAVFIIFLTAYRLKLGNRIAFISALLYGISFPVFFYGTVGLIDPGILFFLSLCLLLIIERKYIWLLLFFIPGVLAKETIIIILPVLIISLHLDKGIHSKYKIIFPAAMIIIYLLLISVIRYTAPGYLPDYAWHKWVPSADVFLYNIKRANTWAGLILALGIPGIVVIWRLIKRNSPLSDTEIILLAGFITGLMVFFYSIIAAYADARHTWLALPFSIQMTAIYLSRLRRVKTISST